MAKQKTAEELITQFNAESEQETVADESTLQTGTPDGDPIVYRYNGNAAAGESMAHVPLADIRQSLWDELEPYMQAGVAASHLYTKAEG